MAREASHVHLVNDAPRGRPAQRCLAFPIVRVWIHHHALHRRGGVVAFQACSFAAVILRNNYAAPVWIDENFGRIKPQAFRGVVKSLHPIRVKLSRLHSRDEHVPIMVGAVGRGIDWNHA